MPRFVLLILAGLAPAVPAAAQTPNFGSITIANEPRVLPAQPPANEPSYRISRRVEAPAEHLPSAFRIGPARLGFVTYRLTPMASRHWHWSDGFEWEDRRKFGVTVRCSFPLAIRLCR